MKTRILGLTYLFVLVACKKSDVPPGAAILEKTWKPTKFTSVIRFYKSGEVTHENKVDFPPHRDAYWKFTGDKLIEYDGTSTTDTTQYTRVGDVLIDKFGTMTVLSLTATELKLQINQKKQQSDSDSTLMITDAEFSQK